MRGRNTDRSYLIDMANQLRILVSFSYLESLKSWLGYVEYIRKDLFYCVSSTSKHSLMAECTKILTLQNTFGAHPASYSVGTRDILPGGKVVEV